MKKIYFTKELRKALKRDYLYTETIFNLRGEDKFIEVWDGTEFIVINKHMILAIVEEEIE